MKSIRSWTWINLNWNLQPITTRKTPFFLSIHQTSLADFSKKEGKKRKQTILWPTSPTTRIITITQYVLSKDFKLSHAWKMQECSCYQRSSSWSINNPSKKVRKPKLWKAKSLASLIRWEFHYATRPMNQCFHNHQPHFWRQAKTSDWNFPKQTRKRCNSCHFCRSSESKINDLCYYL